MLKSRPAAAVALLAVLAAAGCTSSSSSSAAVAKTSAPVTTSGTETLTAATLGSSAAADLNSTGSGPLTFPEGFWAGPVAVAVVPFKLPGSDSDAAATVTLDTPLGDATVRHSANQVPGASNPDSPPPATWTKAGKTCYFAATFSKGTVRFLSGTGRFKGATSPALGTYLLTAHGYAKLKTGKTRCGFGTTGPVQDSGAEVKFTASFPVTVRG